MHQLFLPRDRHDHLVLVWKVGMRLCRQVETSMDHPHLRAEVDVVHEVRQFVVCRRRDQGVDLVV